MEIDITLLFGSDLSFKEDKVPSPYIVFLQNGKQVKTKAIQKTNNPVWNETFKFKANVGDLLALMDGARVKTLKGKV